MEILDGCRHPYGVTVEGAVLGYRECPWRPTVPERPTGAPEVSTVGALRRRLEHLRGVPLDMLRVRRRVSGRRVEERTALKVIDQSSAAARVRSASYATKRVGRSLQSELGLHVR
jgi:hypothetical protein